MNRDGQPGHKGALVARSSLGDREFVFLLGLLSAMSALAIDTILPAFASMREAFDLPTDSPRLSLTITLFFFGTGVGFFVCGPLADNLGRRRVLQLSLALYALASFAGAFAPNLTTLLASRFVWGFAAAGPRILSQAVVRDRYRGQDLGRTMTLIQTFFYVAPIAGPIVGRVLVEIGGWPFVFTFSSAVAVALAVWSLRLEETLAPEDRRPLSFRTTITGLLTAAAHPVTRFYALSIAVGFGAFYSFLGSSELVIGEVFGRPEWFLPMFIGLSAVMSAISFTASRVLRKVSASDWVLGTGVSLVLSSTIMTIIALATNGTPDPLVFLPVFGWAILSHGAMFPTATSIALTPMGELAGTAAAAIGITTSFLGAFLASFIDRAIEGTVTPIAIGFLVYGIIGFSLQLAGRRALAAQPDD